MELPIPHSWNFSRKSAVTQKPIKKAIILKNQVFLNHSFQIYVGKETQNLELGQSKLLNFFSKRAF